MALESMTPEEFLTTTRSVRRLDLERPVPQELLLECLQVAVQAPTGGNRRVAMGLRDGC